MEDKMMPLEQRDVMAREPSPFLRSQQDMTRAQRRAAQSDIDRLKKKLAILKLKGARINAMVNSHAKSR